MNRYELLRYEKGATRGDVAAATKVSTRTIACLESGDIKKPSAPIAKALAAFYGVSIQEFLGLEDAAASSAADAA